MRMSSSTLFVAASYTRPMVESGVAVSQHVAKRNDQRTLRHLVEEIEIQLAHLTQRIPSHLQLSLDRGLAQVIG